MKPITSLGAASLLTLTLALNSWAAQTWTVNFRDSDIQEVIKFVADVTGRTVVVDQRVRGRIKVISAKPLNEDELMHLFRTVLEMNDFSVVDVGDVMRIIPLKDARSSPVPVVEGDSTEKGYLTQVIQLQNIAAARVLPSIRPLVPQHSHLSAYDPSNAIIITDSAENIARIRDLIEMLDKSATPVTEIIELRYANAADLVQVLNGLEKSDGQQQSGSPQNAINLAADRRNNAILITGEDMQRQRMKTLIQRLDRPRAQTGNVRVVYLEYAEAKKVAETLTKVMQNLAKLNPGGGQGGGEVMAATVEADEETNALLITATGDDLETLMDVVARLDIRRPQVLIEAIIAEVRYDANRNLGVQWMFRNTDIGMFGSSMQDRQLMGGIAGSAIPNAQGETSLTGLAAALATATGQVLGVVGSTNDYDFVSVLTALESDGKANILSTPSLLTMDNHEASIVVAENIPILTGSSTGQGVGFSPFQTIQRQDVGIKLTVTPQVNESNSVLLTVSQEASEVGSPSADGTGITTLQRRIDTQILAGSGEMVVLGGLVRDRGSNTESRVPVLGSIPIIGTLFRYSGRETNKTNLMVFLKATVIRDEETLSVATANKYQNVRQRQIDNQEKGFLRGRDRSTPILPDPTLYDLSLPQSATATETPAVESVSP